MKGIIYKITNKVNNESYIGQTRYTLEFRWRQHQHKKDGTKFHNAIQKYGPENFNVEILEECDVSKLDSREIFYIAKYNTFNQGYNLTIGGDGRKKIISDDQYDEIKELYLSGFSAYKISNLFGVDKATIFKILNVMSIKTHKDSKYAFNNQEFQEIVKDYESGISPLELSKRYGGSKNGMTEYLKKKGVALRIANPILKDKERQESLISDYLDDKLKLSEILSKHHCSFNSFSKILSLHGISKGRRHFKLKKEECLEVIRLFNNGAKVSDLSKKFEVDKTTIYSVLKRYNVNYLTI